MSFFSITKEVVTDAWNIGSEVYNATSGTLVLGIIFAWYLLARGVKLLTNKDEMNDSIKCILK